MFSIVTLLKCFFDGRFFIMIRSLAVCLFLSAFLSNIFSKNDHFIQAISHLSEFHTDVHTSHHHHGHTGYSVEHIQHDDEGENDDHTSEHRYELSSLMVVLEEVKVVNSFTLCIIHSFINRPFLYQFHNLSAPSTAIFRPPIA